MRYVVAMLMLAGGLGAGLVQRSPVALCIGASCYRVALKGAAPAPASPREAWAVALAQALGNDRPSPDTVAFLVAWSRAEDGSDGALSRNNPWNTTQEGAGVVSVINSDGVKGYATMQDGLAATVQTLGYDYPGYADIREGVRLNDPARALAGLYASPWGTHAGLVEEVFHEVRAAPTTTTSAPLALDGPCGHNVAVALAANGGALGEVRIAPGETWSFNATMGNPAGLGYVDCAGVPGGGWCNLAARYAQAGRALGLVPSFEDHGIDLGAGMENAVAIWNVDGAAGSDGERQDLELYNPTASTVVLTVRDVGGAVVVEGRQG